MACHQMRRSKSQHERMHGCYEVWLIGKNTELRPASSGLMVQDVIAKTTAKTEGKATD
jgi:hypothetical protein